MNYMNKKQLATATTKYKPELIVDLCRHKTVLDVGCVGQDLDPNSENWLHNKIKAVASSVLGCDINQEGLDNLTQLGFNVCMPEVLSEKQELYDVVVMGDVIEHVNDPAAFLSFYKAFLKPDGIMVVCTPNAYGVRYFLQVFFYGIPSTNPEHTVFFDPLVLEELVGRIDLKITGFHWLYEYQTAKNWKQRIIYGISSLFILFRSYFRPNFVVILSKS